MDWEHIGNIGVDAGLCWVGDPCYLSDGESPFQNWDKFCDRLFEGPFDKDGHQSFMYSAGHEGLGVLCSTGYGDGHYPVYVKKIGNRIAEIKVVFIEDNDDENF